MIYGRDIWGPKAWHLLHSFSINNNLKISESKKHNYYIFYVSFTYIIPCIICSEHYGEIIHNIYPLEEKDIIRKYLIKWVFKVHNEVNYIINKKKYSYKKFMENSNTINHDSIYFILACIYSDFKYDNISLYKYDQIYNFFINFCILYPDKIRKRKLKKLINSEDFKKIIIPQEFGLWIKNNLNIIKKIICTEEK